MQPLSKFEDYSVSLLFPYSSANERDEKQIRATKITNILLRAWKIPSVTLEGARALTNGHYQKLHRGCNQIEIEVELLKLQREKITIQDLRQIAACYGYQIIGDGAPLVIKPLPSPGSS